MRGLRQGPQPRVCSRALSQGSQAGGHARASTWCFQPRALASAPAPFSSLCSQRPSATSAWGRGDRRRAAKGWGFRARSDITVLLSLYHGLYANVTASLCSLVQSLLQVVARSDVTMSLALDYCHYITGVMPMSIWKCVPLCSPCSPRGSCGRCYKWWRGATLTWGFDRWPASTSRTSQPDTGGSRLRTVRSPFPLLSLLTFASSSLLLFAHSPFSHDKRHGWQGCFAAMPRGHSSFGWCAPALVVLLCSSHHFSTVLYCTELTVLYCTRCAPVQLPHSQRKTGRQ